MVSSSHIFLVLLIATGISTGCKVIPPSPPLVETVAVLPFDNESNDVNADTILQYLVYAALKNSTYRPMDLADVNTKLEKAGIVDGGQLAIVDPVKLGKDLGVQALLFGYVENFDYTNIGFYLQRKVVVNLKLIDVNTGTVLWENTGKGIHRQVNVEKEKAQDAFLKGVAEQTIDKLFNSPLEEEAKLSVISGLGKLPGYTFGGFAKDEKSSAVLKKGAKDLLKDTIRK